MAKKNDTNFQSFLKISLAVVVEIFDFALKANIVSFEIYIINSLIKEKNFETNFIMSKNYLWGSTTKRKQKILLFFFFQ